MDRFNEDDIPSANKELQDIILVAQFSPSEKSRFIQQISRELSSRNISLDFLDGSTEYKKYVVF